MPSKPKRPCSYRGCPELTDGQYCELHKKEKHQRYDNRRGTAAQRGYDSRWRKARKYYLQRHPLCVECEKNGSVTPATVVDHIIPHKGDKNLFWDHDNWQPLCESCHNAKTAKEDMGMWK